MLRRFLAAWLGMLLFLIGILIFGTTEARGFWWGVIVGVLICVVWPGADG